MNEKERIEELRLQRGWSKRKLANMAGLSVTAVYDWYNERSNNPSLTSINWICQAMDISLTEFYSKVNDTSALRPDQITVLNYWEEMTEEQRTAVLGIMKSYIKL